MPASHHQKKKNFIVSKTIKMICLLLRWRYLVDSTEIQNPVTVTLTFSIMCSLITLDSADCKMWSTVVQWFRLEPVNLIAHRRCWRWDDRPVRKLINGSPGDRTRVMTEVRVRPGVRTWRSGHTLQWLVTVNNCHTVARDRVKHTADDWWTGLIHFVTLADDKMQQTCFFNLIMQPNIKFIVLLSVSVMHSLHSLCELRHLLRCWCISRWSYSSLLFELIPFPNYHDCENWSANKISSQPHHFAL